MFMEIERAKTLAELHKQEAALAEAQSKILENNMRLAAFAPQQAAPAPAPASGNTMVKVVAALACLAGGAYLLGGAGPHGGGAVRAGVMGSSYEDGPRDHQGRVVPVRVRDR